MDDIYTCISNSNRILFMFCFISFRMSKSSFGLIYLLEISGRDLKEQQKIKEANLTTSLKCTRLRIVSDIYLFICVFFSTYTYNVKTV